VYVDLAGSERRPVATDVALCRVEQLYPFPHQALREIIDGYAATLREIVWVQEEPENMGAWEFMRPLLEELIDGRFPLRYVGRARSASPSEGSAAWHQLNQKLLVEQAFDPDNHQAEATEGSMVLSKQVR
jgi:2-oxoglutarate dehydrogenase E1 component